MKAGATGGIEAAVKAINTHIDNVGLCRYGCGALRSMALNGKNTDSKTQMKSDLQLRTE